MDKFVTVRHLRRHDDESVVSPYGGVTILAIVDLTDEDNRTIMYSLAFCSNKDLYCKEMGRKVALDRMIAGEHYECKYTTYEDGGSIADQIVNDLAQRDDDEYDEEMVRLFFSHQDTYVDEDEDLGPGRTYC